MKKLLVTGLMTLSLAACATPAQPTITLQPQVDVKANAMGKGKEVALQVVDARPQQSYSAAKIDPQQNVTQVFTDQINSGLKTYGFDINNTAKNQLTVQILAIDYRTLSGIVSSNTETFVSAQVKAQNSKGIYTKTYNASAYDDNYASPLKKNPSLEVNAAVNKLLNNILSDPLLMQFLAS